MKRAAPREAPAAALESRFRRAEELFQEALARLPGERPAFLDRACGPDAELRREVESLVEADRAASGFMEEAVEREAAILRREAEAPGELGAYRVIRSLGSGGMSTVYLAVRADDQYRKEVAIKLIKHGMDSEDILRRFRQERQILANLEHPHIARLLDGGTTGDGRPYFVMEHITGLPVDRYCASRRLAVNERLRLFNKVCAGVHFAHQNLVVHRDLKPGNILVDAAGEPRLLDFGIAKLLDSRSPDALTGMATRVMTPEYASPEQVKGGPITTATDVYSLGVLLYELLTGRRPYRVTDLRPSQVERVICEDPPEKPSSAVTRETAAWSGEARPERLRRRLAGDLDNIVLMALRKEPQRRYSSAEQLARDLERHLAGLPVLARKDTLGYRAAKFVGRHRAGVAVAVMAIAAVLTSASFALQQARVATAALGRAEDEKESVERVSAYVESLFQVADPRNPDRTLKITARELLDRGAEKVVAELADQPELRARITGTLARGYRGLGAYDRAAELLREALEIRRRGPPDAAFVVNLNDLGKVLYDRGDYRGAEGRFREALAAGRALLGDGPEVATALNGLGTAYYRLGDLGAAEPPLREALGLRRAVYGEDHGETFLTLHNLASVLYDKGDPTAEVLLRQALATGRQVLGEDHPNVAGTHGNLVRLLFDRHDYRAAESEFRHLLASKRRRLGDRHPSVAVGLNNLAKVLYVQGKYEEALPLYEEALAMKRELLGDDHPSLAVTLHGLAMVRHELGRSEEALPMLIRAVDLRREQSPAGLRGLAEALVGLGRVLAAEDRAGEAENLVREALEILRDELLAEAWQRAEAESVLGECRVTLGRRDGALALARDSYRTLAAELGDEDPRTRQARDRLDRLGTLLLVEEP